VQIYDIFYSGLILRLVKCLQFSFGIDSKLLLEEINMAFLYTKLVFLPFAIHN
jgi:hypothetical protein